MVNLTCNRGNSRSRTGRGSWVGVSVCVCGGVGRVRCLKLCLRRAAVLQIAIKWFFQLRSSSFRLAAGWVGQLGSGLLNSATNPALGRWHHYCCLQKSKDTDWNCSQHQRQRFPTLFSVLPPMELLRKSLWLSVWNSMWRDIKPRIWTFLGIFWPFCLCFRKSKTVRLQNLP